MTPYRKALIEHMTLHGLSDKTLDSYVYWMRDLCAFINQTPDRIRAEDVGRFLIHLIADRGLAYSSVNQAKCGIQYFYRHVMGAPSVVGALPPMKQGSALPEVLSQPEVARLFHRGPRQGRNDSALPPCRNEACQVCQPSSATRLCRQPQRQGRHDAIGLGQRGL